jgi:hypothetical protein
MERIGKFDSKSLLKCVTGENAAVCPCALFTQFGVAVEEYTIHHLLQIENGERIKREVSKKNSDLVSELHTSPTRSSVCVQALRKHIVILDIEGLGMEHLDR